MVSITVENREGSLKPNSLRKQGKLPAVLYGRKEKSTPITLSASEFEKIFRDAGESTILTLEGLDESKEALVHDVQYHPVTGLPLHVDFYAIEKGKKLTVSVPFVFEGEAPAEKLGGSLVKVMHEIEVEVLPKDLPHEIKVDVSSLKNFESQITVADLKLPDGVEPMASPEEVVALVSEAKEEEEAPAEGLDMDSIEVEKKGKSEEDGSDESSSADESADGGQE